MAKQKHVKMSNTSHTKKTTQGNGSHSKLPTNRNSTKKKYRGQGK